MYVRDQEVVQHPASIVSPKHVDPVVPSDDGVLATFGTNKLLTAGELLPHVCRLLGVKVECHVVVNVHNSLVLEAGRLWRVRILVSFRNHGWMQLWEGSGENWRVGTTQSSSSSPSARRRAPQSVIANTAQGVGEVGS